MKLPQVTYLKEAFWSVVILVCITIAFTLQFVFYQDFKIVISLLITIAHQIAILLIIKAFDTFVQEELQDIKEAQKWT